MKRTIKVGIIQQTCTNDIRHNLSKLHHNIEQVAAAGAQLVVLQLSLIHISEPTRH